MGRPEGPGSQRGKDIVAYDDLMTLENDQAGEGMFLEVKPESGICLAPSSGWRGFSISLSKADHS
jgi:ApbE superfamily uncharacterized protein (UPF0280 family)